MRAKLAAVGLGLVGFGAACTSSSDVDDSDGFTAPDVAGRYNVVLEGTNGCDGDASLIDTWATGPMAAAGAADSLSFDFEDGVVLSGSVSDAFGFQMGGATVVGERDLEIFASGLVYSDADRWVFEGDFDVQTSNGVQAEDCTITGPFKAYQVSN